MAGDKVARYGNFTLVTDEHPGTGKNIVHFALEQCRTRINRAVDAVILDEMVPVSGGIGGVHGRILCMKGYWKQAESHRYNVA